MPFVVKTEPYDVKAVRDGRAEIHVPPRNEGFDKNGMIESYDRFAWFFAETEGGNGLALICQAGRISRSRDDRGRKLISFMPRLVYADPIRSLGISDFASLSRTANNTPIERLNQLLYINSHKKAAPVDAETFQFLLGHFEA